MDRFIFSQPHRFTMPDGPMAMNATKLLVIHRRARQNIMYKIFVTMQTIFLQNTRVGIADKNRLMKILERESLGMPESIVGFGEKFWNHLMRQMTINAGCACVMACFLPGVKRRLHDMTIDTGFGVFAKVRQSFAVAKSINTQPCQHADGNCQ